MNMITVWEQNNQAHIEAMLAWIRLRLRELIPERATREQKSTPESGFGWFRRDKPETAGKAREREPLRLTAPDKDELTRITEEIELLEQHSPPPALKLLAESLGLSEFEKNALALCAAQELDTRIPALCALAQDDGNQRHPSFALAFRMFEAPDWSALSPHGALRFWQLIEIAQDPSLHPSLPLILRPIRADERIVNYLKGLNSLDERLAQLVEELPSRLPMEKLPPSQQAQAERIRDAIRADGSAHEPRLIRLLGSDSESKRLVATEACKHQGLSVYRLRADRLSARDDDHESLARLWQRESRLLPLALLLDAADADSMQYRQIVQFGQRILRHGGGVILIDESPGQAEAPPTTRSFTVRKPLPKEQLQLWSDALGREADDELARLTEQFSFNQPEIARLAREMQAEDPASESEDAPAVWSACRAATRSGMTRLARPIDARATWDDIVLPEDLSRLLRQISQQVSSRNRVYGEWGFREKMNRGLGISALFSGPSGTGKTMAAEVIANACRLDLYAIDLSAVISKYIGETEKNLRKLFDVAEDSGAILFFDEADALFGKRSEVKDSHDRYANTQIDYLLQRMEAYPGLAILATNMKSALDKAFTRRLRFIVDFPFPGETLRRQIWEQIFPEKTPVRPDIDFARLARLNLSGGSIHNIALNAAFLAAQSGDEVGMPHLLDAARTEFRKIGQPIKESDFVWQDRLEAVK
ncbi:MAG: AAA family ATPase [Xanthomonadales bacterium]|nr:AAA family ATPase [Xanthomonadales bacterium]